MRDLFMLFYFISKLQSCLTTSASQDVNSGEYLREVISCVLVISKGVKTALAYAFFFI